MGPAAPISFNAFLVAQVATVTLFIWHLGAHGGEIIRLSFYCVGAFLRHLVQSKLSDDRRSQRPKAAAEDSEEHAAALRVLVAVRREQCSAVGAPLARGRLAVCKMLIPSWLPVFVVLSTDNKGSSC